MCKQIVIGYGICDCVVPLMHYIVIVNLLLMNYSLIVNDCIVGCVPKWLQKIVR